MRSVALWGELAVCRFFRSCSAMPLAEGRDSARGDRSFSRRAHGHQHAIGQHLPDGSRFLESCLAQRLKCSSNPAAYLFRILPAKISARSAALLLRVPASQPARPVNVLMRARIHFGRRFTPADPAVARDLICVCHHCANCNWSTSKGKPCRAAPSGGMRSQPKCSTVTRVSTRSMVTS